ncbi:MAG: translation elongation factor Ts [Anaerolineales bacterium]|jgi:elongation factor Ts|nr:translation elongation factor Ts [Anaerolineales bacterium]
MDISVELIKKLRDATGSGILDVKEALENAEGDFDKAVDYLRQKGLAKAAKRSDRDASEGAVELYSHGDGRVGVMVEINCETDFVARSEEFRQFAHEIALQIAAAAPRWVKEDQIPDEVIEHEKEIARTRYQEEGKPDNIIDRILDGMVEKFKAENCLLLQPYIRDDELIIQELLHEKIAAIGENIVIRRFERWERGESIE